MITGNQYGHGVQQKERAGQASGLLAEDEKDSNIGQAEESRDEITEHLVVLARENIQHAQDDEPDRAIVVTGGFRIDIAAMPHDVGHDAPGLHVVILAERGHADSDVQPEGNQKKKAPAVLKDFFD